MVELGLSRKAQNSTPTPSGTQDVNIVSTITIPVNITSSITIPISNTSLLNLDVLLSTRASETTLSSLNSKDFATQTTLALIKAKTDNLDVLLSTIATQATLALIKAKTDNIDIVLSTLNRTLATAPFSNRLSDGAAFYDATKTGQLPSALVGGRLDINLGAWLGSTVPTVGQKTMANAIPVVIASDQSSIPTTGGGATESETYFANYNAIAPAANKYMATLFNTSSTRKVVIEKIYMIYNSVVAVTGVVLNQSVTKITARTAGTVVTIRSADSNDTLDVGVTADTGSTAVTEAFDWFLFWTTSEEILAADELIAYTGEIGRKLYEHKEGSKGITLRQNEGITIQNITSSTIGTFSYLICFTEQAV